jgi:hypothetical protein
MAAGFLFLETEKQRRETAPCRMRCSFLGMMDEERVEVHSVTLIMVVLRRREEQHTPWASAVFLFFFFFVLFFGKTQGERKEGFIYSPSSLLFSWSLARGSRIPWQRSQMF